MRELSNNIRLALARSPGARSDNANINTSTLVDILSRELMDNLDRFAPLRASVTTRQLQRACCTIPARATHGFSRLTSSIPCYKGGFECLRK